MYVDEIQTMAALAYQEMKNNTYYKTKWRPQNKVVAENLDTYFETGTPKPPIDTQNHFGNAMAAMAIIYQEMKNYDCSAPDVIE